MSTPTSFVKIVHESGIEFLLWFELWVNDASISPAGDHAELFVLKPRVPRLLCTCFSCFSTHPRRVGSRQLFHMFHV